MLTGATDQRQMTGNIQLHGTTMTSGFSTQKEIG